MTLSLPAEADRALWILAGKWNLSRSAVVAKLIADASRAGKQVGSKE